MRALLRSALVLASAALCAAPVTAATYTASFSQPGTPPFMTTESPMGYGMPSGYAIDTTAGKATFTKNAGAGVGYVRFTSQFQILGDFSASVEMSRDNLNGTVGAVAGLAMIAEPAYSNGQSIITTRGPIALEGQIAVPSFPGFGYSVTESTAPLLTLTIERVANAVSLYVDEGNGRQLLRSNTGSILSGPVIAQFYLGQERFADTAFSLQASFDNFSITADAFSSPVPELGSGLLFLAGLVALGASTLSNRRNPWALLHAEA